MSQGDEKSHPYLGEGVKDMAARLLWPILLYMVFTGLHNIGIIYAISNTILVFSTIYLSKKSSKKHKTKLLTLGVYFHSLTLVVRTLIKTFSILTIVQGFGALSWTMVSLPFQSIFYNNAKRQGIAYGIFFRELYLNFGRMVGAVLLMLLILFFQAQTAIVICIIIGAIAMIWMTKLREEFKKVPS